MYIPAKYKNEILLINLYTYYRWSKCDLFHKISYFAMWFTVQLISLYLSKIFVKNLKMYWRTNLELNPKIIVFQFSSTLYDKYTKFLHSNWGRWQWDNEVPAVGQVDGRWGLSCRCRSSDPTPGPLECVQQLDNILSISRCRIVDFCLI